MGHRADLATLLHETHAYVESQSGPNVEIVRASQARTMQARIESFEGGASKEEATSLMEIIRDGPWSSIQINNLQHAISKAVTRKESAETKVAERKPQTLWSDTLWALTLENKKPRLNRLHGSCKCLMAMDLTNPDPKMKQRIVAMLALGDAWICATQTNAKVVLDE